jgi:hypothetical protein
MTMSLHKSIREHMPVVSSHGDRFATVDRIESMDIIKLTKDRQGLHHWIPLDWVAWVDRVVHLNRSSCDAMRHWMSAPPSGMWRDAFLSGQVISRRGRGKSSS